jgi:predicted nucleic acid-binding protein
VNVVDTDAITLLLRKRKDPVGAAIESHMLAFIDRDFRITAVAAAEMMRGAVLKLNKDIQKRRVLIPAFGLMQELIEYLARWQGLILPYDTAAERIYSDFDPRLRQELGLDSRIAAVALAQGSAVWTRNSKDYIRFPQLIVYRAETGERVA